MSDEGRWGIAYDLPFPVVIDVNNATPTPRVHFESPTKEGLVSAMRDLATRIMGTESFKKPGDQPPPTPNAGRPVWELVIEDMRERDRVGRARYGTPLQTHNGRNALVDAYQEALDLVVYLRQAIEERG